MWLDSAVGNEAGREWPATLDVPALRAEGWAPVPFREFIVKVHSRCNLACDYCYVYEMADQSWREQPRCMSPDIAQITAERIAEHAKAHRLDRIAVVLHGGEPLLAGGDLITDLVTRVLAAVQTATLGATMVETAIQTNAVRLDEQYLRLFDDLGVTVGVSLDGAPKDHDRHRRFKNGPGSYADVTAGLARLIQPRYRHLFSGLLCTIDLQSDPIETYEALAKFEPPEIDFLLPHGTWDVPPPGRVPDADGTPYADWLIAVFDHWYPAPTTRIRLFDEIMHLILGGTSAAETVGLSPSTLVVIETDGSIEQGDVLKATYPGAPQTGLHVARNHFDEALLLRGVVARQLGERALSAECRACRIRKVCGGGLYAHRYRAGTGFANPSVYCPDLFRFIGHIRDTMRSDLGLE